MKAPKRLVLSVVPGIPFISPGDELGAIITRAIDDAGLQPANGDIVVVAQKIVSKTQDRFVDLESVVPSLRAREVAPLVDKDPRLVEVILSESVRIVRQHRHVLVTEHRAGYISANAGVDHSNVHPSSERSVVLRLPIDPGGAADELRTSLQAHYGKSFGVIISDSFGRLWRRGTVGVALGASGLASLNDLRGHPDLFGRPLEVTETGFADEVASAASLLMGQADDASPVVIVSGFSVDDRNVPAVALIRPASDDLFR